MDAFQQYQSFASEEVAQPLLRLLQAHGIATETGVDRLDFDVNFANNPTDTRFVVRLRAADIEKARQLEDLENDRLAANAAPDHYLFSFTDEELFDVLTKPDEWNSYDVTLAGRILRQRGRVVSADAIQLLRRHRTAEIAKPEPTRKAWIVAGYLSAILGGIIALLIGWHLYSHKKPLPDGSRVYAYAPSDRVHGFRILLLGIFGLLVSIVLRFLSII